MSDDDDDDDDDEEEVFCQRAFIVTVAWGWYCCGFLGFLVGGGRQPKPAETDYSSQEPRGGS